MICVYIRNYGKWSIGWSVLYIAEVFAWDNENEGWEDIVASSLFECGYLWSGKASSSTHNIFLYIFFV